VIPFERTNNHCSTGIWPEVCREQFQRSSATTARAQYFLRCGPNRPARRGPCMALSALRDRSMTPAWATSEPDSVSLQESADPREHCVSMSSLGGQLGNARRCHRRVVAANPSTCSSKAPPLAEIAARPQQTAGSFAQAQDRQASGRLRATAQEHELTAGGCISTSQSHRDSFFRRPQGFYTFPICTVDGASGRPIRFIPSPEPLHLAPIGSDDSFNVLHRRGARVVSSQPLATSGLSAGKVAKDQGRGG